ncbi:MAG: redox-regulated ATPase YchF [Dehalococcoidia bacterium]
MPELGIVGFERSGKTTLLNAVTGSGHPTGFATHQEPHLGVVKVPDPRLDQLSALFQPKKTTPADLQYVDFPGAGFGGSEGPALRFLDQLSLMDALIHVVRAFDNDAVPHPQTTVDPARDIDAMTLELVFADLGLVEKRLQRIAAETKALKASEREAAARESGLLGRVAASLGDGVPMRAMPLSSEERKQLRQYRFLTDRPLLTLLNINEADAGNAEGIAAQYRPADEPAGTATAAACATLEMELNALSLEEAEEYRREVGATEGALAAALRLSYEILGLRSFFTIGDDECRAWTIRAGVNAQEAAGKIHSDMGRGFIRAEVVDWHDLVEAGSEAEAKKRAQLHTEGKDYVVQDGDVLHILFNV